MLTPAESRELERIAQEMAIALPANNPALAAYRGWQHAVRIRRADPPASAYCD
jgi:hypothetical protein